MFPSSFFCTFSMILLVFISYKLNILYIQKYCICKWYLGKFWDKLLDYYLYINCLFVFIHLGFRIQLFNFIWNSTVFSYFLKLKCMFYELPYLVFISWKLFCFYDVSYFIFILDPQLWPEGSYKLGSILSSILLSGSVVFFLKLFTVLGPIFSRKIPFQENGQKWNFWTF